MGRDYYSILGVSPSATQEQIRLAYMRRALEVHPDRNPSPSATREFQELADAYYTLGTPSRRHDYDATYTRDDQGAGSSEASGQARADDVFGDVFEDFLRPSVESSGSGFWATVGMGSGAVLGFIVANLPGAVAGGYAGRKLGSIRDQTGRAVYESFQALPHARKLQILTALAAQLVAGSSGLGK
ncbi:DnaJ-domain-containing protein [Linderina pennispora]|uniref:DnaJ-domain-containing protein n=1 Tax=Linderina pennispora TaxID=61395 RepID=A0A1Y1WD28_9FUNG|nr:DnaJ-domain-containing protein [Linderina pennispora]ORX71429.1 DnaJ-domain-containing protein [Linderina pennispora]